MVFAPDAIAMLRRQLIPSIAYYLNWSSIYGHTSYFQQTGRPPLLLHLWSLAVEEQFYLIWPVVALLVLRRYKGQRGRRMLRTVAISGALLSAGWMAFLAAQHGFPVPNDPSRAYYGTDTHASGLMLGAAFACVWPLGAAPKLARYQRNVLDAVGRRGALLAAVDLPQRQRVLVLALPRRLPAVLGGRVGGRRGRSRIPRAGSVR